MNPIDFTKRFVTLNYSELHVIGWEPAMIAWPTIGRDGHPQIVVGWYPTTFQIEKYQIQISKIENKKSFVGIQIFSVP